MALNMSQSIAVFSLLFCCFATDPPLFSAPPSRLKTTQSLC